MLNPATRTTTASAPLTRALYVPRWIRLLLRRAPVEETSPAMPLSTPPPTPEHRDPPPGVTCRCYPR